MLQVHRDTIIRPYVFKINPSNLHHNGKSFSLLTECEQVRSHIYHEEAHSPSSCFSKVPAFLNVTDIAGLVKGASEGQGLGNAFLSHIKACDAIFHLCSE